MKILFAADGSKYTKKALAFLVTHEGLTGDDGSLVVLNVQPNLPPRVKALVGAQAVRGYHADEAAKVLQPIERFLARHPITSSTTWAVGMPAEEIVDAAARIHADLIVMGTHGHGVIGRALMGSVAQHVVTGSRVPVLLVK